VERRELAAAEYETKLQEAEAAARVWVGMRDLELSTLERELTLKSDELITQAAALAASEIAAENELRAQRAVLDKKSADLENRLAELTQREERLHSERTALDQAMDKFRAERRREEETHRSRQQKWHTLFEADRAQAERALANLQKHRQSLEQREAAVAQREVLAEPPPKRVALAPPDSAPTAIASMGLSIALLRAEATRDHRAALEHRWVAGQLWSRLVGSALASDDELQDSLERVREQLELMYHRERTALEQLRDSLAETARQVQGSSRTPVRPRPQPRKLAYVG
jgi:DNA repair exonuclease SbcCD ATPase subunit